MYLTLVFSQVHCEFRSLNKLEISVLPMVLLLWGHLTPNEAQRQRADGTSYCPDYGVQNLFVKYLEFLISAESTHFWDHVKGEFDWEDTRYIS